MQNCSVVPNFFKKKKKKKLHADNIFFQPELRIIDTVTDDIVLIKSSLLKERLQISDN